MTSSTDAWDRWRPFWHVIFYVLIIIAAVIAFAETRFDASARAAVIILALALSSWYYLLVVRHPEWNQQIRPNLIYMLGAAVIALALVLLHPIFFMVAFNLWAHAFRLLPVRWAASVILGFSIILIALWIFYLNIEASLRLPFTIAALSFTGAVIFLSFWIDSIIDQSQARKKLIEELESTRRELAQAERQAGMLEERGRLAREIHDTLAQGFTSIVMHLEAAEEKITSDTAASQKHLTQAKQTARQSLSEARRVVAALRPELLEGVSLSQAIEHVATHWSEESGLQADVHLTGDARTLPPEVEVTLLRVAQEALANVRRHSQASRVTLTLSYMDDAVALDVQDDGQGFTSIHVDGFGLKGMRERVEGLNGTLVVESDDGVTVAVELPI